MSRRRKRKLYRLLKKVFRPIASTNATKLALEKDVNLLLIDGTGKQGKITIKDVKKFLSHRDSEQLNKSAQAS